MKSRLLLFEEILAAEVINFNRRLKMAVDPLGLRVEYGLLE
jgi:hypothetical protein